jgi:hypothetical protein
MSASPSLDPTADHPFGKSDLELPYKHTPAGRMTSGDAPILPEERPRSVPQLAPGTVPGLVRRPKRVVTKEQSADQASGLFGQPPGTPIPPVPVIERVAEIAAERPAWLWPGRIRRGELTMLFGEPCSGKSFVAMDIVARVSRGDVFPGADSSPHRKPPPGQALMVVSSETHRFEIHDRLVAAGADTYQVFLAQTVKEVDMQASKATAYPFNLPEQLGEIEAILRTNRNLQLVVIDSLENMLDGVSGARAIRQLLLNLDRLAQRFNVAMLVVQPFTGRPRWGNELRNLGPAPFLAVPRTIWGIGRRSPEPGSARMMYPLKLTHQAEGVLQEFEIQEGRIAWSEGEEPTSSLRAAEPTGDPQERITKFDQASVRLGELLQNGPVATFRLQAQMEQEGFSWRTCERVKKAMKIGSALMPPLIPEDGCRYAWFLKSQRPDLAKNGGAARKTPKQPLSDMERIEALHQLEQAKLKSLGPGGLPVGMKTSADELLEMQDYRSMSVPQLMANLVMQRLATCKSPEELQKAADVWSVMDQDDLWLNTHGIQPAKKKKKKATDG